jgi:bacillithiol system protein YtxJ
METIITDIDVAKAILASEDTPILIYKHSPICGLSETAILEWRRFMADESGRFRFYQVDVVAARQASLKIENLMNVRHESPQILLIWKSECQWHASHRNIREKELKAQAELFFQAPLN